MNTCDTNAPITSAHDPFLTQLLHQGFGEFGST